MSVGKNVMTGLIGGLIGGAVLSMIDWGGMKTGKIPTPVIVEIEHRLEDKLNIAEQTSYGQKIARSQILHFGTTALYGIVYGLLRSIPRVQRLGDNRAGEPIPVTGMQMAQHVPGMPPAVAGPLFGLGVFAAIMGGLLPALGLSRSPLQMKRAVALRELAMHLLFGSILAAVVQRFSRGDSFDPHI
jgi:hypothetical protein